MTLAALVSSLLEEEVKKVERRPLARATEPISLFISTSAGRRADTPETMS